MGRLSARLELHADRTAPHEARQAAREALQDWGLHPAAVEDAVLAISELVTNAVLHARTPSVLEIELGRDGKSLRLTVADQSLAQPVLRRVDGTAEHGRGLAVLAALSDRWGIEQHGTGKRVWCDIPLAGAAR